jgi:hypothetical protein
MSKKKEQTYKFKKGDIVQTKMTKENVQVMKYVEDIYSSDGPCYIVRFWTDKCTGSLGEHKDIQLREFELEKKNA